MQVAAVGDEVAVGIDHLVVLDRLKGVGRVDGGARQVVILADADKGEQLLPICDGHRADPGLLVEDARHLLTRLLGEALVQHPHRPFGNLEGAGREGNRVLLQHGAVIEDHPHEHGGPQGIGHQHGGDDVLDKVDGIIKGAGHQQNDPHLHQLGDEGHRSHYPGAEQQVEPVAGDEVAMHQAAEQPFGDGGGAVKPPSE